MSKLQEEIKAEPGLDVRLEILNSKEDLNG